jgi:hypothetical protein
LWDYLMVGTNCHFIAKDLEKHSEIYTTVMSKLQYYTNHVKGIYLKLMHVKGDVILSAPN